ncbi:flavin reductase [Methylobrevis pamukkalensis]|uniref:NADH:FAD oxidoreductase n=1 Tax=Methylobrevis pamukkalensis TaxID=1439726 RepID=A0A1E3H2U4_9HYPH|nr:flavin reductase [Methylobrevis pamukkalensis]ODN70647.1 NADH:FAD oxidoreductase [Methylobrevis pamukkalensis]
MSRPPGPFPVDPAAARPVFAPADSPSFRNALARVPAAVVVVATDGPAGAGGFTATAFTSVSDDPPTILVCLNRKSAQNETFRNNGVFSVNMLAAEDQAIANDFAGFTKLPAPERFRAGDWTRGITGAPMLLRARVSLDCELVDINPVATHNVMIGRVIGLTIEPPVADRPEVLLYHDRRYREI